MKEPLSEGVTNSNSYRSQAGKVSEQAIRQEGQNRMYTSQFPEVSATVGLFFFFFSNP
jgi:hypothetical protein